MSLISQQSGVTKAVAERLAEIIDADVFEIKPAVPYSRADLDWTNQQSRSSIEMRDINTRPEIAETISNMEDYDIVWIGFRFGGMLHRRLFIRF